MKLAAGTPVAGRYVVEAPIGTGGMAVVYRVRHLELGTAHALKLLKLRGEHVKARLLREGRLQGTLRHPHVLTVTDVVEVQDMPGLIMELVEGPTLRKLLEAGPVPADQLGPLAQGILEGVAAAHAHGLVHRDLKPDNVLLSTTPTGWIPKIADFGLAKAMDDEDQGTRTGMAMGTPSYMAPEQFRDAKRVDARADVFACGAILYEMITGQRAFTGSDDMIASFQEVSEARYTPLTDSVPGVPLLWDRAVRAALQPDRGHRPVDGAALLGMWTGETPAPPPEAKASAPVTLDSFTPEGVVSRLEAPAPPSPPTGRRRPGVLAGGALLVGALVVGALIVFMPEDQPALDPEPKPAPDIASQLADLAAGRRPQPLADRPVEAEEVRVLPSGLRVVATRTTALPLFGAAIAFRFPFAPAEDARATRVALLVALQDAVRGTLATDLAALGTSVSMSEQEAGVTLTLLGTTDQLGPSLRRAHGFLSSPRWPSPLILAQSASDAQALAAVSVQAQRTLDPLDALAYPAAPVAADRLQTMWDRFVGPANATMFLSGDTSDAVVEAAMEALEDWQSPVEGLGPRVREALAPEPAILVAAGPRPRVDVLLPLAAPDTADPAALQVAVRALGARLQAEVHAMDTGSFRFYGACALWRANSVLSCRAETRAGNDAILVRRVRATLTEVERARPLTPDEIALGRHAILGDAAMARSGVRRQLRTSATAWLDGASAVNRDAIRAVTPFAANEALRLQIDPETATWALTGEPEALEAVSQGLGRPILEVDGPAR